MAHLNFGNRGNRGGAGRPGPKYRAQATVGLTDEHFDYLRRRSVYSLAEALRDCVEECMRAETKEPGSAVMLAGPSLQGGDPDSGPSIVA